MGSVGALYAAWGKVGPVQCVLGSGPDWELRVGRDPNTAGSGTVIVLLSNGQTMTGVEDSLEAFYDSKGDAVVLQGGTVPTHDSTHTILFARVSQATRTVAWERDITRRASTTSCSGQRFVVFDLPEGGPLAVRALGADNLGNRVGGPPGKP
jgi:hypothetical protein